MTTCPECGSERVAQILWGMPGMSPELQADIDAGRVVVGGCFIDDPLPNQRCASCGADFKEERKA